MPDWSEEIRERLAGLAGGSWRDASSSRVVQDDRYAEHVRSGLPRNGPGRARRARGPGLADCQRRSPSGPGRRRSKRRRLPVGPGGGLPLRRAAPPARACVRARGHPLARARHRREHGDLPARSTPCACASLPVARPRELVNVRIAPTTGPHRQLHGPLAAADDSRIWDRIRADQKAFSKLAGLELRPRQPRLAAARPATPRRSGSAAPSSTPSASGRCAAACFGPADDSPGARSPAVVLSEPFWRREFGATELSRARPLPSRAAASTIVVVTPERSSASSRACVRRGAADLRRDLITDSPRTKRSWSGGSRRSAACARLDVEKAKATLRRSRPGSSGDAAGRATTPNDAKQLAGFPAHAKAGGGPGSRDLRDAVRRPALAPPRHLRARSARSPAPTSRT